MKSVLLRMAWIAGAAAIGWCVGWMVGFIGTSRREASYYPFLAEHVLLPHHVPKYAGGVSLRFAMVHDVIHERYPRATSARYRERERLLREKLATLAADDPAEFPLADDLAGSLDRLGR